MLPELDPAPSLNPVSLRMLYLLFNSFLIMLRSFFCWQGDKLLLDADRDGGCSYPPVIASWHFSCNFSIYDNLALLPPLII
jgi:hypothetical protein